MFGLVEFFFFFKKIHISNTKNTFIIHSQTLPFSPIKLFPDLIDAFLSRVPLVE